MRMVGNDYHRDAECDIEERSSLARFGVERQSHRSCLRELEHGYAERGQKDGRGSRAKLHGPPWLMLKALLLWVPRKDSERLDQRRQSGRARRSGDAGRPESAFSGRQADRPLLLRDAPSRAEGPISTAALPSFAVTLVSLFPPMAAANSTTSSRYAWAHLVA